MRNGCVLTHAAIRWSMRRADARAAGCLASLAVLRRPGAIRWARSARAGLLELEAAVGAGALDEGGGRAAGRAGRVLGGFVDRDRDRGQTFAREIGAPAVAEQLGQAG